MSPKKYDFNQEIVRKNTNSKKWDNMEHFFECECARNATPMWIADMDFHCPEEITDGLSQRVSQGVFGYTFISDTFFKTIKRWMSRRHGVEVSEKWISFSPGIMPAIVHLILSLTNQDDSILIQSPVYYPFFHAIKNNQRNLVINPLTEINLKYLMDFDDLERKIIESNVKIMILCNPHNPIGRVYTENELMHVVTICKKHQVILISDEIHADIIFKPNKHTSILHFEKEYNQIVALISPSKSFNLAGLLTSAVIIPNEDIRRKFIRNQENHYSNQTNVLGQLAMEIAYSKCDDYLEELMDYLSDNIKYVIEYISNHMPDIDVVFPEGTYLLWLDFRKIPVTSTNLARLIIEQANVALDDGIWFGSEGKGFLRMNVACSRMQLKVALDSLNQFISSL